MSIGGLEALETDPAVQIIITDSEAALAAAKRLFPTLGAILANGESDWSPLAGRRLVLMPTAGREAGARSLADTLAAIAAEIKLCAPEAERAEGWSIASEAAWTEADARAWTVKQRKTIKTLIIASQQIPAPQVDVPIKPLIGEASGNEATGTVHPSFPAPQTPADAGTVHDAPESPPSDFPPLEAYPTDEGRRTQPAQKKTPRRAHLKAVPLEGNLTKAVVSAEQDEPLPAALSDDALADHLAAQQGENWQFVAPWCKWFEWDGDGWRQDDTRKIDRICLELTREAAARWPEAGLLTPTGKRQVNCKRMAGAVRDNLSSDRRIAARLDQWDRDSWLLGCPGGVLDLRAGKMLEAERGQYITKRCAVAPEHGKPTLWLAFLNRILADDDSLLAYLQRLTGYAMTGETSEHSLAFLYGTGANGKTVFLQTISGILGDYAVSAGIETFTETKNERHSTEIARLRGARLVVTEETDSGGRWAEGKIKRLTGGGKISAHFMRQDDFEFTPQFKLMIAGNHKPQLRAVDEAIRRRFHLVPFGVTIPVDERDKHLMEKLREEWPQILGWMLDGCVAWQDCSLGLPEAIQRATDQYLEAEDTLGLWIEDCCEREGRMESARGYQSYGEWCDKQGERSWSRRAWANALVDRGFSTGSTGRARTIEGLSLKMREPPQA